jgi:hypothetical protein
LRIGIRPGAAPRRCPCIRIGTAEARQTSTGFPRNEAFKRHTDNRGPLLDPGILHRLGKKFIVESYRGSHASNLSSFDAVVNVLPKGRPANVSPFQHRYDHDMFHNALRYGCAYSIVIALEMLASKLTRVIEKSDQSTPNFRRQLLHGCKLCKLPQPSDRFRRSSPQPSQSWIEALT